MGKALSNPWGWILIALGVLNLVLIGGVSGFVFWLGLIVGIVAIATGFYEFVRAGSHD